jgi:hypothetical protein
MYSGLAMYIRRPPTSRGMPAFGIALSLRRVTGAIRSTKHVRTKGVERTRDVVRFGAIRRDPVQSDRHLRDDRLRGIYHTRGSDGLRQLVQIAERLQDEAVDAAGDQPAHLLGENRLGLLDGGGSIGLDAHAERSDGARDKPVLAGRFARQSRRGLVDRVHFAFEPELCQLEAVGAERVGLQCFRPRLDVGLVHVTHEIRRAQVQVVVALIDEHAPRIEHRPHCPVEDEDGVGIEEPLEQCLPGHSDLLRDTHTTHGIVLGLRMVHDDRRRRLFRDELEGTGQRHA